MSWAFLLGSVCAQMLYNALPSVPSPGSPVSVEWDATRVSANITLTGGNLIATNTGVNNTPHFIPAAKAIVPGHGKVYWEIVITAVGAAAQLMLVGVVGETGRHGYNTTDGMMFSMGVAYRQNGALSNYATFGTAATITAFVATDVIMLCLDAGEGKLWLGRNGTWFNDPASNLTPTIQLTPDQIYYPAVNLIDNADSVTLKSIAATQSYAAPTGSKPYGNDLTNYNYQGLSLPSADFENAVNGSPIVPGWTNGSGHSWARGLGQYSNAEPSYRTPVVPNTSYNHVSIYPANSAATVGQIWTRVVFPPEFDSFIDAGVMALRLVAHIGQTSQLNAGKFARIRVRFYDADAGGTLLSTLTSGNLGGSNYGPVPHIYRPAIPATARSFEFEIELDKVGGSTTSVMRLDMVKAAITRKLPTVFVDNARGFGVIRPKLGVQVSKQTMQVIVGSQLNSQTVSKQTMYVVLTP